MQNKAKLIRASSIITGDIVWTRCGATLSGPFLAWSWRTVGYGSNKKTIWMLMNTENNEIHQSELYWIYIPARL
jgi:hypothetical protein